MVNVNGGGSTALGLIAGTAKIVYAEPYGGKYVNPKGTMELNSIPTSADFIIVSYEGKSQYANNDATKTYPTYEYIISLSDIPENTTKNSIITGAYSTTGGWYEGTAKLTITNNNNSSYNLKILGDSSSYDQYFNKLQITAFKNLK